MDSPASYPSIPLIWALIVGIDRYESVRDLRGACNDADAMEAFLREVLGVPPQRIRKLTARLDGSDPPEQLATRENIIRGFTEHLTKAKKGDQIFFHYSGHGSYAPTADPLNEPDGWDETLVPCDSRSLGIYDIVDNELAGLLEGLAATGAQISVFLDCCHSGSGLRAAPAPGEPLPEVRVCEPDLRSRPPDTLVARSSSRGVKPASGWLRPGDYVLLAGCRDEEEAREYWAEELGRWHGAMTYLALQVMRQAHPDLTYAALHDQLLARMHSFYERQTPQCEGDCRRLLFGGIRVRQHPYLRVLKVLSDRVLLDGGQVHGLTPGSVVAIYPPGSQMADELLTTATIKHVEVAQSWAWLDAPGVAVPVASRARITHRGVGGLTRRVALAPETTAVADAMAVAEPGGEPSRYLVPVGPDEPAEFRVWVEGEAYVIAGRDGRAATVSVPVDEDGAAARVVSYLEHMTAYLNALQLTNDDPLSGLAGKVQLHLKRVTQMGPSGRPLDVEDVREAGGQAVVGEGDVVALEITNHSDRPLYVALFDFDPEWGISRIYPPAAPHMMLNPFDPDEPERHKLIVAPLRLSLADPEATRGRDTLKLFAAAEPTSFDILEKPPLVEPDLRTGTRAVPDSPLGQLLEAARRGGGRKVTLVSEKVSDLWTTTQVSRWTAAR
ncbi:MAG TPA: hypothetical protein EYP04_11550 [Anaerolineae bacterium]|nr:hypothetical protein [Anaerolineae bacterium]